MEKSYKNCQSCGMPLKRDIKNGGTNSDGSRSKMYCSNCYENGHFTNPTLTPDEIKNRLKEKLIEFGIPKFLTGFFTKNIPNLERWKIK